MIVFVHGINNHSICKLLTNSDNFLNYGQAHHIASILSQPHFEGSVRLSLTFPKMGLGSPLGLPKIQSSIAKVKTPCIGVFFIPLERSRSVDVQNGLA